MIFTRFINPNNKFFSRWRLCLKGTRGAEIIDALKPYCLDITDFLEEGTNKIIIKVTNTPINFLEGVERESGFSDEVKIIPYNEYILEKLID